MHGFSVWLGVLTAWRPQGSLVSSMSPKQEYSSEQGGNYMTFYDPLSKISQHQFCQLYWPKTVTSLFRVKARGIRLPILIGRASRSHCPRA